MTRAAMQQSRSALLVLGLLGVLGALAGACGDDDEGDSVIGTDKDPFNNAPGGPLGAAGWGASGSSSSSGGSSAVGSAGPNCPSGLARTSRITPRVILVLDGSCSMSTPYPANGAPSATNCGNNQNSRWSALHNVLLGEQGVVRQLQGVVEFGVVIFGTEPNCPLTGDAIRPAINNFETINRAFPANTPPGRYTPTGPALDYVYTELIDKSVDPDGHEGPQIVLLATDGEPNSCDNPDPNYDPSLDALRMSKTLGVPVLTYVVSLADATGPFHDHLQQLADIGVGGQGGTLYSPNTPAELRAALETLIGGAVGCDIMLNGMVTTGQECKATVTLNGDKLDCNGSNGWILTDPSHIRLQGSACDKFKATPTAVLAANFACGTFMVM
jgi:hypothetical protein